LGRGRGADARETARLCLWRLFAPTAVAVSLAIVLARNELGKVFTSSPHVQRLTAGERARVCVYACPHARARARALPDARARARARARAQRSRGS
jgi:hypothetical protein